jgi:hypothetical protein
LTTYSFTQFLEALKNMIQRLIGILTLQAPVYKEVAEDQNATSQAAIITAIAAILSGIGGYAALQQVSASLGGPAPSLIGSLIQNIIVTFIGWFLGSWLLAWVSKTFFKGDTNTGEMLRVTGFTRGFGFLGILGVIPILGGLIGLVSAILGIIGNIIGIREAAGFDTTKAIISAIIAGVIAFLVAAVLGGVVGGLLGVGGGLTPLPTGG